MLRGVGASAAAPTLSQRERGRRRGILSLLLALSLLLVSSTGASAHANLERSSPNANAVVVEKPQQVFLWFSEEPELRLTELTLLDPTGRKLADLAPRPAPGDPRAVTANVPDIQPGTF